MRKKDYPFIQFTLTPKIQGLPEGRRLNFYE